MRRAIDAPLVDHFRRPWRDCCRRRGITQHQTPDALMVFVHPIVSIWQQLLLELSSLRILLLKTVLGRRIRLLTMLLRRRIQRRLHSARRRTPPLLHRLPTHRHVIITSVQLPPPIKLEVSSFHKLFSFFSLFLLLLLPPLLQTLKMLHFL